MWRTLILAEILVAVIIYLMLPIKHCACGVKIPEGGGLCECGEYNHRMFIHKERREDEKKNGNSYDTFL